MPSIGRADYCFQLIVVVMDVFFIALSLLCHMFDVKLTRLIYIAFFVLVFLTFDAFFNESRSGYALYSCVFFSLQETSKSILNQKILNKRSEKLVTEKI